MLMPWAYLNGHYTKTAQCTKGENRIHTSWQCMRPDERAFSLNVHALTTVMGFNYLGCISMSSDDDCLAVAGNLRLAHNKWARMLRIQGRKETDVRKAENLFKATFQEVLLFGSATLVLTLSYPGLWEGSSTGLPAS